MNVRGVNGLKFIELTNRYTGHPAIIFLDKIVRINKSSYRPQGTANEKECVEIIFSNKSCSDFLITYDEMLELLSKLS